MGTLDASFRVDLDGAVLAAAVVPGTEQLWIAGEFTQVNGEHRTGLARLNGDGSVDGGFAAELDGRVEQLLIDPAGAIFVEGQFGHVNGVRCLGLARLGCDGGLDPEFKFPRSHPGLGPLDIYAMALQADGKLLIGGYFGGFEGIPTEDVARVNADGSLDPTFAFDSSYPISWATALAMQPDGRILVGGYFMTLRGDQAESLFRLMPDGALDPVFARPQTGWLEHLLVQPGGRLLLDGLRRLEPDGMPDAEYFTGAGPGESGWSDAAEAARAVALLPDGGILVRGRFLTFNNLPRTFLARLRGEVPALQLDVARDPVTGAVIVTVVGPAGAAIRVESSGDLLDWAPLFTQWPADGVIRFQDPVAESAVQRFYRALVLE